MPKDESETESEDSGTDTRLKSMLLRVGLLTTDQLSEALRAEAMTGKDFETIVVERGWIDRTELEDLIETKEAEQPVEPSSETEPETVGRPLNLVREPESPEAVTDRAPEPDPEPLEMFGSLPLPTIEFESPSSRDPFETTPEPTLVLPEVEPAPEPQSDPFAGAEFPTFPEPFAEPFVVEVTPEPAFLPAPVTELEPEPTPVAALETTPAVEFDFEPEPVVDFEPEPVVDFEPEPVVHVEPAPVVHVEPEPVVHVEPEPVVHTPAITPETRAEPQPETAEVTVVHRVFARLSNGERVQVTSSSDRNAARSEAKALMAYLREASGDWPFLSARFVRPESIISVDLETELQ